jgi:hypothetical protein
VLSDSPNQSEYDVTPEAAPHFQMGELWALLHSRGFVLGEQGPRQLTVAPNGRAMVMSALTLEKGIALEPARMAADVLAGLRASSPDVSQALLAGYVRMGYEWVDHQCPGFTDALQDVLQCPTAERPRPRGSVDVAALLHALGATLAVTDDRVKLLAQGAEPLAAIWQERPREAFEFLVALLVVGVDCSAIYTRDAPHAERAHPLHAFVLPGGSGLELQQLASLAPGVELPLGLLGVMRRTYREPYDLNDILFWVRKVLLEFPDEHAQRFGDTLTQVALHCAKLADAVGPGSQGSSQAHAQMAVIFAEYTARGTRSDEVRLVSLTHALHGYSWYPKPYERWRVTQVELGLWNSWLQTYRAFALRSFEATKSSGGGALRSAALRGLYAARRALPMSYRLATCPDPELAVLGLPLLRVFLKSHAILISELWALSKHECEANEQTGWRGFFEGISGAQLALEMAWSSEFLAEAAQKDFSFEVARRRLQAGLAFLAGPDELDPAPPSRA